MAISLTNKISKAVTTTDVTWSITTANPVELSGSIINDRNTTINLASFNFIGNFDDTTTTVVVPANNKVLNKLKIGDVITIASTDTSGATLPAGTVVASKNVTAGTFTLDKTPTNVGTGDVTFASDPTPKTEKAYTLREKITGSGSTLTIDLYMTTYDTMTPTEVKVHSHTIKVDKFLEYLGVDKTNDETLTL